MAGQRRKDVEGRDITGLKYFQDLLPLFERLHEIGCQNRLDAIIVGRKPPCSYVIGAARLRVHS
jgi:hypothetical protein